MTDGPGVTVRPATERDLDALVELNNAAVPAVSAADRAHLRRLVDWAAAAWVVDGVDGAVAAFVLLFEPGSDYASPNYRWFVERFDRFLYVDRVVVAAGERGSGLGSRLYDAVAVEAIDRGSLRVTAEVNLEPPNPGSSRFHRRHGFERVGVQELGPGYSVEMLARPVTGTGVPPAP